jgi:hypothetical protein
MAGGKETPRQKMIGMMYLVLTALLALNVSKEIIRAFVTINDKLDASGEIVKQSSGATYQLFQGKKAALVAQKSDTKMIDFWMAKADQLKARTNTTIHYILSESNEMIKEAEGGTDWVAKKDDNGNIRELKPLLDISAMDNYDIPTNRFIGGNPMKPIKKGTDILDSIHAYRDYVVGLMANYKVGNKEWSFTPPSDPSELETALLTANPEDTAKIKQFYEAMTLPAEVEVKEAGQTKNMPWPSVMFDHAPIVAACAMLTSLKVDVLNAESVAAEFMVSKVEAPVFTFNKIEPLAFARTGYINAGDSLDLSVMIAAYDSTEIPKIRYGINADTVPENWKEITGKIGLPGSTAGEYKVKGQIGVKEKGEVVWKNWDFRYTVGKPSGAVSLPEMNVLYRGYNNKLVGAVSGYTGYKLSGSNVSLSKSGEFWIGKPGGAKTATVNIAGIAEDGSSANVGKFEFRVQNLPAPSVYLGALEDGQEAPGGTIRAQTRLFAKYPPEIPLNATFSVVSWEVSVAGAPRPEKGSGSSLSPKALSLIKQAQRGATITFMTVVKGPDGKNRKKSAAFKVK